MQRVFNFRDAYSFFSSQYQKRFLAGKSFVFYGKEGTGKTHLLNLLEKMCKKDGINVFRARSFSSNEALMYQAYNELLNQFYQEFKERQLPEIVEAFSTMDAQKLNGSLFIIDGLENMPQNSRDLFIYFSRVAARRGFSLLGTITENYVDDVKSLMRFLDLIGNEPDIWQINFEKTNLEDIKFFLKLDGYNLPLSFIQELYRLTNGNVRTLRYTLQYYADQGIINEKKSLEEVTYRYFPIPPSAEIRFEQIIKSLDDKEKAILEVVSLIQDDLTPGFVSELTQSERKEVIETLEKLSSLGLLTHTNLNYSILNSRLSDIVLKLVYSSPSYIISDTFVQQPVFKSLPFITRLRVFELRKDDSSIEDLVNGEWREFISRISYIAFSHELLTNLQGLVKGKEAKAHLALILAQALQNLGDFEGAMAIYSNSDVIEIEPVFTKLSEARLLQKLDKLSDSIDVCKNLLEMKGLKPYDRVSAINVLAVNYSFSNILDEGVKNATEAAELASKHQFPDLLADAYGSLGTLMVKKFDLKKALDWYNKSLELSQKYKYFDRELLILNNVAIIHSYWGQLEKAAKMLAEIIEKSYISGELLSRAYATYNLCEIYYNIDQKEEFRSYFPSATGLVRMVGEGNLAYPFFRFASLVSLDIMNTESAVKYTEELLKVARSIVNKEKEDMSRGLYLLAQPKLSSVLQKELESLFEKEFTEVDDFLPIWYLFGGVYFCLTGDTKKAKESFSRQKKAANTIGDSMGSLYADIGSAFENLIEGNVARLKKLISAGFSLGEYKDVYPKFKSLFQDYISNKKQVQANASTAESFFTVAAAILMGLKPADIEKGGLNNFNYFQKCRTEIGKKVEPI